MLYNQETFFETVRAFSGQGQMLIIPRELLRFTGDINETLLLSQLIYWQDKGKRDDGWIYKTYAEWEDELQLSKYQIMKAAEKLKKEGFLLTKVKKANGSPTVHYKLNWQRFSLSFVQFLNERKSSFSTLDGEETSLSLTELTTENTTEITTDNILSSRPGQVSHQQSTHCREIIFHLNQKCNTSYRDSTKKTQQLIQARMNDGFTLDDFKTVIDKKAADWLDTEYEKFLRPETLFGTKFESYLNQKEGAKRVHRSNPRQVSSTRGAQDGRTFGVIKR